MVRVPRSRAQMPSLLVISTVCFFAFLLQATQAHPHSLSLIYGKRARLLASYEEEYGRLVKAEERADTRLYLNVLERIYQLNIQMNYLCNPQHKASFGMDCFDYQRYRRKVSSSSGNMLPSVIGYMSKVTFVLSDLNGKVLAKITDISKLRDILSRQIYLDLKTWTKTGYQAIGTISALMKSSKEILEATDKFSGPLRHFLVIEAIRPASEERELAVKMEAQVRVGRRALHLSRGLLCKQRKDLATLIQDANSSQRRPNTRSPP